MSPIQTDDIPSPRRDRRSVGDGDSDAAWHASPAPRVVERLGTSASAGLTRAEAAARLQRFGPNLLTAAKRTSAWSILIDQLRSVVVLLLLAAAGVALLLGDGLEAAAILVVLLINTALGFVTEMRARRAMEALLRMEAPRATVVRGGATTEVDARDLVPGDLIRLEAGAAVPADARLVAAAELRTVEAALTGESLPVAKAADAEVDSGTPLPDRVTMLYKGTAVATGSGTAVVVATGAATELGQIGGLVGSIGQEATPLERRLDRLGGRLVWLALAVGAVVTALGASRGMPLGQMIEAGIALAIAAVPEGLPAVATIALAVGVRRMARRNALVRRLPSVETLGSVTVICTDKTGTLTAGEMMVTVLAVGGRRIRVSGAGFVPEGRFEEGEVEVDAAGDPALATALRVGALANRASLDHGDSGWSIRGDPTEGALLVAAAKAGIDRAALLQRWPEVGEVPFSSERLLMATFHDSPQGGRVAQVKGAPGPVLERSTAVLDPTGPRPMTADDRRRILEINDGMADRGLRVLALAECAAASTNPDSLHDLTFVGLVGMIDPPAEGVLETVSTFRGAGIRTVMITGDQALTAGAVARELGILSDGGEVLGGRELDALPNDELARRVGTVGVFCRVSPEAKLRIVTALQAGGEIVAMLGDGVNDAPALKKAEVGVAMGIRGTDVAREAASVVLQDDRFRTIGAAVEEGRVIYDNIRKFVFYLFSCNLAEVCVLLGAGLAGLPLPLLPLQILWLNVVTDTFPALALALEPAEPDVMRRAPRPPGHAILSRAFLRSIVLYALLITASTLAIFLWGLESGEQDRAVTLAFITLALAQTFHLGNARSREPVVRPGRIAANRYALGAVVLTVSLQLLAVHFPPLARVLHVVPLGPSEWLVVFILAAIPAVIGQALRVVRSRRRGG